MTNHRFYADLARFWPLLSPVSEYASEAAYFISLLESVSLPGNELLELGSGGGHNAFYLRERFRMTLSDLSGEMLAVSASLNPDCEHVCGDMRSLRLGREFDGVFIHDAIDYMTNESDLRSALTTAFAHCRPGGTCVIVPDSTREIFEPGSSCGGTDGDDGRGIRYLEWTWDPDASDDWIQTEYSLIARASDGTIQALHESHRLGLFAEARWLEILREVGFDAWRMREKTDEDRTPRTVFVATKPSRPDVA